MEEIPWLITIIDPFPLEIRTMILVLATVLQYMEVHGGTVIASTLTLMANMSFTPLKMVELIQKVQTGFVGGMMVSIATTLRFK